MLPEKILFLKHDSLRCEVSRYQFILKLFKDTYERLDSQINTYRVQTAQVEFASLFPLFATPKNDLNNMKCIIDYDLWNIE